MSTGRLTVPVTEQDHVAGSINAPVILVEYGDFECPHCGAAYPVVEIARRELGDQLCFVYRHFPLSEIHPYAEGAAEAAEAAGAQGRFWPMHHALFENQQALDEESLVSYAAGLRLDAARFATELSGGVHAPRVRSDFMSGVRSGVNGTPTFFINGIRYDGMWSDTPSFVAVLAQAAAGVEAGIEQ